VQGVLHRTFLIFHAAGLAKNLVAVTIAIVCCGFNDVGVGQISTSVVQVLRSNKCGGPTFPAYPFFLFWEELQRQGDEESFWLVRRS
jgi:hypothetical protein